MGYWKNILHINWCRISSIHSRSPWWLRLAEIPLSVCFCCFKEGNFRFFVAKFVDTLENPFRSKIAQLYSAKNWAKQNFRLWGVGGGWPGISCFGDGQIFSPLFRTRLFGLQFRGPLGVVQNNTPNGVINISYYDVVTSWPITPTWCHFFEISK